MKYSYLTTEEDVKEACFKSVIALAHYQRRRLTFSLVYPMLIFLLLLSPDRRPLIIFTAYILLVSFFYFYYFQKMIFKRERHLLNKGKKWKEKQTVYLTDEFINVFINRIERNISWDEIESSYKTKENIILYLNSKNLEFIIIKRNPPKDIKEDLIPFFLFLDKKLSFIENKR